MAGRHRVDLDLDKLFAFILFLAGPRRVLMVFSGCSYVIVFRSRPLCGPEIMVHLP